jgi:hypothetical protein
VNSFSGVQNPEFHPLVERKIKEEGIHGYKAKNYKSKCSRKPLLQIMIRLLVFGSNSYVCMSKPYTSIL